MPKMGVLPTQAEVISLRQRAPNSLESAAIQINRYIALSLRAEGNAVSYRISAGQELIRVRKRISAEGLNIGWEQWCADNINRSYRDIQRLMRMAGADDPQEALEQERTANRASKTAQRARATDVSRPSVRDLFFQFLQLDDNQRMEFVRLVREEMENGKAVSYAI